MSITASRLHLSDADRAHIDAEILRGQANDLLKQAAELDAEACKGWALSEVDTPVRFVATIITPNRHVAYPEQTLGLYAFLKDIETKYPNATGIVLSIAHNPPEAATAN